jgi:hypothetical protein
MHKMTIYSETEKYEVGTTADSQNCTARGGEILQPNKLEFLQPLATLNFFDTSTNTPYL